jgi:hypothetical protein
VINHRAFTNEGAKIALGKLIVDASLAENKAVIPLQAHHHRDDRRASYAASNNIATSSIRGRYLRSSMNMSCRHHPHGRSLAYSAASLGTFDADQQRSKICFKVSSQKNGSLVLCEGMVWTNGNQNHKILQ